MKIWSSHLLDNLSNCLMTLKNSGDSTGFEPMTSAMPVQCSNQLSYEVTQWRAGQFVGLMFSRERNVIWKKCYMQCGVCNQMKIWSSHLLDNLSNWHFFRTNLCIENSQLVCIMVARSRAPPLLSPLLGHCCGDAKDVAAAMIRFLLASLGLTLKIVLVNLRKLSL